MFLLLNQKTCNKVENSNEYVDDSEIYSELSGEKEDTEKKEEQKKPSQKKKPAKKPKAEYIEESGIYSELSGKKKYDWITDEEAAEKDLLFYESFSHPDGSLLNNKGEKGFKKGWKLKTPQHWQVYSYTLLSYGTLKTSGGYIYSGFENLAFSGAFCQIGNIGAERLCGSFLTKIGDSRQSSMLKFKDRPNMNDLQIGISGGGNIYIDYSSKKGSFYEDGNTSADSDTMNLVCFEIIRDGDGNNEVINAWLNPSSIPKGNPDVTLSVPEVGSLFLLTIQMRATADKKFDEIRLGKSMASVLPGLSKTEGKKIIPAKDIYIAELPDLEKPEAPVESILYLYEGFEYKNTNLLENNGGQGWAEAWTGKDYFNINPDESLTYMDLKTSGGMIAGNNSAAWTKRNFKPITGTFCGSFLFVPDDQTCFIDFKKEGGQGFRIHIKDNSDLYIYLANEEAAYESCISEGKVNLICFKIIQGRRGKPDDIIKVWVNPDSMPAGEPHITFNSPKDLNKGFDFIMFCCGTRKDTQKWDEFRLGTTWEKVVPGMKQPSATVTAKKRKPQVMPKLLLYEGFEYENSLVNQNGGQGWRKAWDGNDYFKVIPEESLSYKELNTTKGMITGGGPGSFIKRYFKKVQGTFFGSFLVVRGEKSCFFSLKTSDQKSLKIGLNDSGDLYISLNDQQATYESAVSETKTNLICFKVIKGTAGNADDVVKLWINPEGIPTEEAQITFNSPVDLSQNFNFILFCCGTRSESQKWDEFRLGRTWGDILPGMK